MKKLKSIKSRINKSKDGKALASNFAYLMVLQLANYAFPLITIPYLARVIGVDGVGKIAFAAAVIMLCQTVADWGFNYTATRDLARNKDSDEAVSKIFSNVLWARILLMFVALICLILAIIIVPYFRENSAVLLVTFLLVPGHILFPEWFFQAMERMKFITLFSVASKAIFTVMIFVFVKDESDYILHPLFLSLGYTVSGTAAMFVVLMKWDVKLLPPNWGEVFKSIKGSTDVFINNIMPNFYNNFSVIFLGFVSGATANGLLDAGSKFVNIVHQFMMTMSKVFFPFLSRRSDKHSVYLRINLTVAVICSCLLFVAAPFVIAVVYTEEFEQAVPILRIMSLSIVFVALVNIYGVNYMIVQGHSRQLRNITVACSLMGFVLAVPLIYYMSAIGAAIVITFTKFILAVVVSYKAKLLMHADS